MHALQNILKTHYHIQPTNIVLLRKMIGAVYKIETNEKSYIFKVYKQRQEALVTRTLFAINHLKNTTILVPQIYQTVDHKDVVLFQESEESIGILFQYIDGVPLKKNHHPLQIANILQTLHKTMDALPINKQEHLGKKHYLDRFLNLLKNKAFAPDKIHQLTQIGNDLYQAIAHHSNTFCHGDFHNENMLITKEGQIYVIDFDTANYTNNVIDIATFNDQTNFNNLDPQDIKETAIVIKKFLSYYDPKSIKNIRVNQVLSFIPLRHMELIATIASVEGQDEISDAFLEEQYHWITAFYQTIKQATIK